MKIRIFLFVIGFGIILFSFYPPLRNLTRRKIKATKIVLYAPTPEETLNNKNISFKDLAQIPSKEFTNDSILSIINRASILNQPYIVWKGHTYGKLILKNNDSCIIRISRYGGFFKNLSNNVVYSFGEENDRENWDEFINDFISPIY